MMTDVPTKEIEAQKIVIVRLNVYRENVDAMRLKTTIIR